MRQLQDFDQQLELIRDKFHPDFQYKDITSFSSREITHSYQLFAVQVLYRLCVCTLHSSIVPLFSGISPDARISRKLTCTSAGEAVKHSRALIGLAADLLGVHSDKSRCPSFTGYAMFMAVSIQFKSLAAQGLLRGDVIVNLYPAIAILDCLKRIWRTQESLVSNREYRPPRSVKLTCFLQWKTLASIFKGAGLDINSLPDTRQLLALPERSLDLDQITAHSMVDRSGFIYTYAVDEESPSGSSRQTSPTIPRWNSPMVQAHPSFGQPPSFQAKPKENSAPTVIPSALPPAPVQTQQDNLHMYRSDARSQVYDINQEVNRSQHHGMLRPNSLQFATMNPVIHSDRSSGTDSGPSSQSQFHDMGYMGVDISMGIDNMDLDTNGVNLWYERLFEAIPTDQYGWWYAGGGCEVPVEDTFYTGYTDK